MANTFTDNFNFIKSEIGGDNQSWGNNLHSTLVLADSALAKTIEDQLMSGITSTAIDLTASGSNGIISTSANLKYFESVVVGDKIRVSGSSEAINGTAAAPVIHTVTAKTSADSITTNINVTTDTSSTITVAKVLQPVHINSGPIVCAPLANLSAATRTAGGVGVPGTDATDAFVANGDVTLGATNTNTVTFTAKVATDILPSADGSYDLGASGAEWQDLHIDGTANIDSLVADTADINGGTVDGITSLSVSATTIPMTGYTIGDNAEGNRTVSTSAASGGANGDIWYEY
tara:strand:+ start:1066 stop:1935 length:870 start_codon:yes stop_codon:yes gene_type:complete